MAEADAKKDDQANTHAVEVDANKLIRKNGVLGFEKSSGFEDVTNFDIAVEGYVGDGGHVIGYFLLLEIKVRDPQAASGDTPVSTQSVKPLYEILIFFTVPVVRVPKHRANLTLETFGTLICVLAAAKYYMYRAT